MSNIICDIDTRTLVLVLTLIHIVNLEPVPDSAISNGSNWYPLRLDNWPKRDESAIWTDTERFYYVHGNEGDFSQSRPFLALKSNYFQDGDSLVSDSLALSFKYWSNSGTTHFQSTSDTSKDVLLNQTGQWVDVSNIQIPKSQWPYYEFYNEGNFNFILKDIRVQSVNNEISQSKQPHASMTSIKSGGSRLHMSGVEEFDFNLIPDITKSGGVVSNMLQFEGMYGSISSTYFRANWTKIEFKLRLRAMPTFNFQASITNELITNKTSSIFLGSPKTQYKFRFDPEVPQNLEDNFQFSYDSKWDNTKVNLTIYPYIGFALSEFKVDGREVSIGSLEKSSEMTIAETGDTIESRHFLVTSPSKDNASYVNLWIDDSDLTKEFCFLWVKSSNGMSIDLYLTLHGESYGRKVAQLDIVYGNGDEFCTSSLMYLRLHEGFQLTFVFKLNGIQLEEPFLFNLNYAKLTIAQARSLSNGLKGQLDIAQYTPMYTNTILWWLYNPKLFDYAVESTSKAAIYVCDMMANCFPYERNQELDIKRHNQTVWSFTIPEEVKKLLIYSPVIRIYTEATEALVYIDAPYLRSKESLLERIKTRLISSSSNLNVTNSKEANNKFQIRVPSQTRIPLAIPIDEIDLRANVINITIGPIGSQISRRIHLVSVKLNNQEAVSNIRIDTSVHGGALVIATDEFISIRPWKLTSDIKIFVIEFEVDEPSGVPIDLQIEISVKVNDHRVTYSRDLWSVLPNRMWDSETDFPNERVTIFTPDDPRALIVSKWIHSGSGMTLNNMDGEVEFRFSSVHPLTKSDIQVTRIVIGTANTYFTQTPMEVNVSPTGTAHVGTLKDDFKSRHENQILLSGPFRVGYLVEVKVNASEVTLYFTPKIDRFPAFDLKNCDKGPTYGDLDCRSEVYHCPEHYFTQRALWGGGYECVPVKVPHLMQDLCDPFIGCANIFDRPLPSSANYTSDYHNRLVGNAYFPAHLNKQNHLRVNRPASHNASQDFCVKFDYIAYQSELIVTDSLTSGQPDTDGFTRHDREWYHETVCESKFNTHVEAFYFYFVPLLSSAVPSVVGGDIAQHMIANLRYVIVTETS